MLKPNRAERRKMEQAGKIAVRHWMRDQAKKGRSLEEMAILLDIMDRQYVPGQMSTRIDDYFLPPVDLSRYNESSNNAKTDDDEAEVDDGHR